MPLRPGVWTVDPTSRVGFVARQFLVHRVRGWFSRFSATVEVAEDRRHVTVHGQATAASITTGDAARDAHLRSSDFLDVEQWPELHLTGVVIAEAPAPGAYLVDADLTIRSITRTVRFDVVLGGPPHGAVPDDGITAVARATVDRSDFGLRWTPALETGGVVVADRVDLVLDLVAHRSQASPSSSDELR